MKKLLLISTIFLLVAACQPTPPSTGVPTDIPPLPTLEPLPTLAPLPTYTQLPTLEPLPTYTDVPTLIPPTVGPTEIEPTIAPQVGYVKVLGTVSKLLLREVCWNVNGFVYNAKGFPIMSDCIYPIKGAVSDRIKYMPGNKIEVEILGDVVFASVHGFRTNANGVTVKADGGERYFVATERGANGELLYVAAWLVKVIN